MRYIVGLDIHKRETEACIQTKRGRVVERKRFPTSKKAFKKNLDAYAGGEAIIESVGFHRPVAKWLRDQDFEVHIAHAGAIPRPKVKTDKKDALHLGNLYRAGLLPESYLAPEELQRLRDLARQRQFLGQESRRLKTKLMHDLIKHGHFLERNPCESEKGRTWLETLRIPEISSTLRIWLSVHEEMKKQTKELEQIAEKHPDTKLLCTIPGVGAYTAVLILAEVADFRRFKHKDAVAAYAGLGVRQMQSGDTDVRGSITKEGNKMLRWALVEAVHNHLKHCPDSDLARRHHRLRETKNPKKATIATARVLLTIMYTMVIKNEPFRVNPSETRA